MGSGDRRRFSAVSSQVRHRCQSRDEPDTHHRVRHIPVLRGGELAGIVSIGDVVKHRLKDLELETNVLRDAYHAAR